MDTKSLSNEVEILINCVAAIMAATIRHIDDYMMVIKISNAKDVAEQLLFKEAYHFTETQICQSFSLYHSMIKIYAVVLKKYYPGNKELLNGVRRWGENDHLRNHNRYGFPRMCDSVPSLELERDFLRCLVFTSLLGVVYRRYFAAITLFGRIFDENTDEEILDVTCSCTVDVVKEMPLNERRLIHSIVQEKKACEEFNDKVLYHRDFEVLKELTSRITEEVELTD
jgi:hypothetical protein